MVIQRWSLALSELDYNLGFIAGSKNVIADSMSRLCEDKQLETPSVVAPLINISAPILETFKLTKEQRDNISFHHNDIVGHMGVQSTIQRLLNSALNWLHMRQHLKKIVKYCPVCQKLSALKSFSTIFHFHIRLNTMSKH